MPNEQHVNARRRTRSAMLAGVAVLGLLAGGSAVTLATADTSASQCQPDHHLRLYRLRGPRRGGQAGRRQRPRRARGVG